MNEQIVWSPGVTLEEIEKQVILKAFRFYRGNKTTTAGALGIAVRTLDNKLEKYENDGREQKARDDERREKDKAFFDRQRGITRSINDSDEEREAQRRKAGLTRDGNATAGIRVESPDGFAQEHAMPVSESQKVQSVLHAKPAHGGPRSRR